VTTVHLTVAGIIIGIIIGAVIGALGRLVLPGRQNIGMVATILVGIVAAIIGTIIAGALGVRHTAGIDWIQLIIQVALAALGVALVSGGTGRGYRRGYRRRRI
jgi:uncharacterized membrane protein YeaQ/YmgE (transglycosylase-associated protein family)